MRALVRTSTRLEYAEIETPTCREPDDVLIRVLCAGVCRTDVAVAEGRIPVAVPRVLGHEFSGIVAGMGQDVRSVTIGDFVSAIPAVPCGVCTSCTGGAPELCQDSCMLGVDRDGAFAEYCVVPERALLRLPATVAPEWGAYVEPIAASLAVLKAQLPKAEPGLVLGENRIARLTQELMIVHGFQDVSVSTLADAERLPADSLAFAIETVPTTAALQALSRLVRPGGTIVLKSRSRVPVEVSIGHLVRKELSLRAVNYAPFGEAIAVLASGAIALDQLIGDRFDLLDFPLAFSDTAGHEDRKPFFLFPPPSDDQDELVLHGYHVQRRMQNR